MSPKTKLRIAIVPSSANIENPVFTRIKSHGVANSAFPLKKAIFHLTRLWGDILTFNVEQFQLASLHSAITNIFYPTANPLGVITSVEIRRIID
jgi:hypothetical protein